MARFFPDAARVSAARDLYGLGSYHDVARSMGADSLPWPHTDDLGVVIDEFSELALELGLAEAESTFMVLVPVCVNGATLTTPILLDVERRDLAFTSHPALGAGTIPPAVLDENTGLAAAIRSELLGTLATWRNAPLREMA